MNVVDGGRLWHRLSELAEIGGQESGGVTRLSFTEEERAAKDMVASYMQEVGLSVREDPVGYLFGRREGRYPDAPAILVGAHVDSVYEGGNFDGPLGVFSGIEVAQTMEEGGVETGSLVEVVAFTDEEGAAQLYAVPLHVSCSQNLINPVSEPTVADAVIKDHHH